MEEPSEPRVLQAEKPKRKLPVKISDVVVFAVIVAVSVGLVFVIIGKLQLKHDVAAARTVSDKVVADIGKRDGAAALTLGSSTFKSSYTADALTKQFKTVEIVTSGAPIIDRQVAVSGKNKTVLFVYKYPPKLAKLPYFIRVAITQDAKTGTWQLTNITGNADETQL